jgi:apolipoprotein D and lipocalin family protein
MRTVKRIAFLGLGIAFGTVLLASCAAISGGVSGNRQVPEPAKPVDLDRYLGKWYEFARYENRFERGCEAVTAEYGKRPDGLISVLNACQQDRLGGEQRSSKGRAKVTPESNNAKLRVSFFGPFWGDYWVLDHADDYSWSIVGEPSGKYLWILTREPKPAGQLAQMLLARARSLGYDTSMLRLTQH